MRQMEQMAGRFKYRLTALLGTALVLALVPAQIAAQLSLSTIVSMAQRNSTQVRIAETDVRKAQAVLTQTKDVFIPSAILGAGLPAAPSLGFFGTPPAEVTVNMQSQVFSLSQLLYIKAARISLQSSLLGLKNAREQVALDASTAYIELDTIHSELDAVNQQTAFADRLVKIEQERAEAGVDGLSQFLDAKLTAAEIKLKRIHLESRSATLKKQLETLTGLPASTIITDPASIPEIPNLHANDLRGTNYGIDSARMLAKAKQRIAQADTASIYTPQINFNAEYYRHTTLLNDADLYFRKPIPTNNFNAGFSFVIPIFDFSHKGKAKESAADALRAKVEAEQAERQSELEVATLTGSLRELDARADVASLKQQIATQQIQTVEAQMNLGNGSSSSSQIGPKTEQLSRIDERQKFADALDAELDLAKVRLNLLHALGHIEDWLRLLNSAQAEIQPVQKP